MGVGKFIKENSKLLGVATVCGTWITSRLITARHYERVNEQRLRLAKLNPNVTEEEVMGLTNMDDKEPPEESD